MVKRFKQYLNEKTETPKPSSTSKPKENEKLDMDMMKQELKRYSDVWSSIQKPKKHNNNKNPNLIFNSIWLTLVTLVRVG